MAFVLNSKVKLSGHFKMVAINAETRKERFLTEFDNLIVNQGLDFIGKGSPATPPNNVIYYGCVVGTGTTPPSATDTSLQTFLAGTLTVSGSSTSDTGASAWQTLTNTTYQFAAGVATGNLTEVGIVAPGAGQNTGTVPNSVSPIFSRALIMVGGVPGTITILASEILQVTYTLVVNLIQTPQTGTFSLNTDSVITTVSYSLLSAQATGSEWTFPNNSRNVGNGLTATACFGYPNGSTLGLPNGTPTGTSVNLGATTVSVAAYTAGAFFLSATYTIPIAVVTTSSSFGALLLWASTGSVSTSIQIAFTPAIAKTNAQTMQIISNIAWSN